MIKFRLVDYPAIINNKFFRFPFFISFFFFRSWFGGDDLLPEYLPAVGSRVCEQKFESNKFATKNVFNCVRLTPIGRFLFSFNPQFLNYSVTKTKCHLLVKT
jgi:hypothetical protein